MSLEDPRIDQILKKYNLYQCLECGKCSASCPRLLTGKEYSPWLVAHKLISERDDEAFIENQVWECLTCGLCEERCPSAVDFSHFILEMRTLLAEDKGLKGFRSHDGALHSWMRMMTSPDLVQKRLDWVVPKLRVSDSGPIAYFVGCAPYFDVFFSYLEVDTLAIARDSIRLLNFLDIEPVLLEQERCCGHDLLWTGDRVNFESLCRLNYEAFKAAKLEEIVVSCPECYLTLTKYMPECIPEFDIKITLIIDLLENEIKKGGKSLKPLDNRITFQDPCRLGRFLERYNEPRNLLKRIPELKLNEMENSGRSAICCGTSCYINCDAYSKRIQVSRLREAKKTDADMLITACPKCMIHLMCAKRDPINDEYFNFEIKDLVSILADQIEWTV